MAEYEEADIFDLDDVLGDTDAPGDEQDAAPGAGQDAAPGAGQDAAPGDEQDAELNVGASGGIVLHYYGGETLEGVPTRAEIVAENDDGVSGKIRARIDSGDPVIFMPVDIEETNDYCGGFPCYVLRLFGPLMDGSKAEVVVTGIDVFFDVRVPAGREADFEAHLCSLLDEAGVRGRIETVSAYPIRGYRTAPEAYKRVHLSNVQQRKKALDAVIASGLETASDDRVYYKKAAREYGIPLSDWAILAKYTHGFGPTNKSPLCEHTFRVPVESFRPLVDSMAPEGRRESATRAKTRTPLLARDRTLVLAWDIETYSARKMGDLPDPQYPDDNAFMICMTVHWKDDPEPLEQICLVDVETAPDLRWTTVVCGDPRNILRAFALCWRALAPDIQTGFNDSDYDWPFVVTKARKFEILSWMVSVMSASPRRTAADGDAMKWNYQNRTIKISAEEEFTSKFLKVPGCVPVDVRVCYKKLFPKSETVKAGALKFYLEVSGLPSKADMPMKRMWQYYEAAKAGSPDPGTAEHMRHVAHYCVVDAVSCQRLLVRRNVINDYREVSTLAFVSLSDSHYYAGGMKVCNLLGAYAWRRDILVSMISRHQEESGKYPGAYVFPPAKGLVPDPGHHLAVDAAAEAYRAKAAAGPAEAASSAEAAGPAEADPLADPDVAKAFAGFAEDRPVTGLDFSSLYPSLIMTYNLSPEKILLTKEEADYWEARGRRLHKIEFTYNNRLVHGWSVCHENRPEEFGLYPSVLVDLFNKRVKIKAALAVHGSMKELIELVMGRAKKDSATLADAARLVLAEVERQEGHTDEILANAPGATAIRVSPGSTLEEELANVRRLNKNAKEQHKNIRRLFETAADGALTVCGGIEAEYQRVCFDWTCANTKQGALKVYMNTFYGEAGNSISPFFLLQLAGGVTAAGQYNIKLVADFVRGKGFYIKYGDSVSGDSALVLRRRESPGVIYTSRIDELAASWEPRLGKETARVRGVEVWRDGGFTPITRVIRHRCDKRVVRVLTGTGVVDCTRDHGLLDPDGRRLRPDDVRVSDRLLHADDRALIDGLGKGGGARVSEAEAFDMGRAAAAPSAASRRSLESSRNAHGEKRVPDCILTAGLGVVRAYWRGLCAGAQAQGTWHLDRAGKEMCTGVWLLGRRLGWEVRLDECPGDPDAFRLTFSDRGGGDPTRVRKVRTLSPRAGYVYDLETGDHHFNTGPGDLVVHNTDSIYVVVPEKYFVECDKEYASGELSREEYWAAMVRVTMRVMTGLRDEVNAFLRKDNGSPYLKMAYEEVLYPVAFTGKKKYFGIPHLNEVNFRPEKLFIRGIDVVKQGQPGLAREIGHRIMWSCMRLDNTRTVLRIVEDVLRDAIVNGAQWKFDHFIKTDAWKPNKDNKAVHQFYNRMKSRHAIEVAENAKREAPEPYMYELPDPGERFSYVLVKTGAAFDLRGRKLKTKKGGRMEYPGVAKKLRLEIDIALYMISYVIGLCARFINGDAQFQPPESTIAGLSEKRVDKMTQDAAKKYLENFIKNIEKLDGGVLQKRGVAYRRAYGQASSVTRAALVSRVGSLAADVLHGDWIDFEVLLSDDADDGQIDGVSKVVEALWRSAKLLAESMRRGYDEDWCKSLALALGIGPDDPRLLYAFGKQRGKRRPTGAAASFAGDMDRLEVSVRAELVGMVPGVAEIASRYEASLSGLVDNMRFAEHGLHPEIGPPEVGLRPVVLGAAEVITDPDKGALLRFRQVWMTAVGLHIARLQEVAFAEYLQRLKDQRIGVVAAPPKPERDSRIADAAARLPRLGVAE